MKNRIVKPCFVTSKAFGIGRYTTYEKALTEYGILNVLSACAECTTGDPKGTYAKLVEGRLTYLVNRMSNAVNAKSLPADFPDYVPDDTVYRNQYLINLYMLTTTLGLKNVEEIIFPPIREEVSNYGEVLDAWLIDNGVPYTRDLATDIIQFVSLRLNLQSDVHEVTFKLPPAPSLVETTPAVKPHEALKRSLTPGPDVCLVRKTRFDTAFEKCTTWIDSLEELVGYQLLTPDTAPTEVHKFTMGSRRYLTIRGGYGGISINDEFCITTLDISDKSIGSYWERNGMQRLLMDSILAGVDYSLLVHIADLSAILEDKSIAKKIFKGVVKLL